MIPEISEQQREALERLKSRHGRKWKSELVAAWMNGRDADGQDGGHLRSLRNNLGIDGLYKLKI